MKLENAQSLDDHLLKGKEGQCANYDLLLSLPSRWGTWTGNQTVPEEMKQYCNVSLTDSSKARLPYQTFKKDNDMIEQEVIKIPKLFGGETLKIPFKPPTWQKLFKQKSLGVQHGADEEEERPYPSGTAAVGSPAGPAIFRTAQSMTSTSGGPFTVEEGAAAVEGGGEGEGGARGSIAANTLSASVSAAQQLAYGAVEFKETPVSPYCAGLSLTELLIASPYFQHLSTDKYRMFENFAVLSSYKNKENVLAIGQKFFSIYFVR